jgi:hypothetical protein
LDTVKGQNRESSLGKVRSKTDCPTVYHNPSRKYSDTISDPGAQDVGDVEAVFVTDLTLQRQMPCPHSMQLSSKAHASMLSSASFSELPTRTLHRQREEQEGDSFAPDLPVLDSGSAEFNRSPERRPSISVGLTYGNISTTTSRQQVSKFLQRTSMQESIWRPQNEPRKDMTLNEANSSQPQHNSAVAAKRRMSRGGSGGEDKQWLGLSARGILH